MDGDVITGFPELGIYFPRILFPDQERVDLKKWAVVACDQYTSEEDYWKRVEEYVGEAPSTLRLTFPEVYLEKGRDGVLISGIRATMERYESEKLFKESNCNGFVLVERTTRSGIVRRGLVLALDLEQYSFKEGTKTLIRPTEKTIEARIPPRLAIRRSARVEIPHIIVLIDDPSERDLITQLAEEYSRKQSPLYDTDLMENSGHVRGYFIDDSKAMEKIQTHLHALLADQKDSSPLLFAVGDGNHSLATAKALWEEVKKNHEYNHPARYALVEIQNCQDPTLEFEPINRLIFGGAENLLSDLKIWFENSGQGPVKISFNSKIKENNPKIFEFVHKGVRGSIHVGNANKILPVAYMTDFLDAWLTQHKGESRIDYVHETAAIDRFCTGEHAENMGFIFSSMPKSDLFRTVVNEGVLPRKTFSMGRPHDKRFYLEARYIV